MVMRSVNLLLHIKIKLIINKICGGGISIGGHMLFSALKNGYIAEEKFILRCMENDITISKPISNTEPYDFIVEQNGQMFRVQVKKAWKDKKNRSIACLKSSYPRSNKSNIATKNNRVDYIAILDINEDWYIIPRNIIKHIKSNIAVSRKGHYSGFCNVFIFINVKQL